MALPAHALPLPPRAPTARLFSQPPTIQQTTSSHGLALQIPHHDPSLPRDSARAGARGGAAWPSNMAFLPFGSLACQPQNRFSDPSLPAHPCSLWFTQCFEVANRVQYPRGPLRLRARYLGGAPRTIWLVHSERQRPAGSNCRWAGGGAVGGSACLAGTAAAGQANLRGSKFLFVCFRRSTKISARPVTNFQQKLLGLVGYRGCSMGARAA